MQHDATVVEHDGVILATILPMSSSQVEGIDFLTSAEEPMQLGRMVRPSGHTIPGHRHDPQTRTVHRTQEVLFVRTGLVRLTILTEDGAVVDSFDLGAGDVALLSAGGHALEFLEKTEIVEAKLGPYLDPPDKHHF